MQLNRIGQVQTLLTEQVDHVTYLFLQLHNRRFIAMEMALITLIEQSLMGRHAAVQWLLHDFNRYYCTWLQSRKFNVEKERDDLRSLEHDNYLLAYCQGVEEMEEILTEACDFVTVRQTEYQRKLVEILIKNYKRRFL